MYKICYCSDIHFDHLESENYRGSFSKNKVIPENKAKEFCDKMMEYDPNSIIITGDISTAKMLHVHLDWLVKYTSDVPIYFVLGNHDFYHGSIKETRDNLTKKLKSIKSKYENKLKWLNIEGVVQLTDKTALFGHDGWYDGGYSDWFKSNLQMNEYFLTSEFRFQPQTEVYKIIRKLAQECSDHIDHHGTAAAIAGYKNVLFATHVPPFRENSLAPDRTLSDKNWLPNMSSKLAGDALIRLNRAFPEVRWTILSGHTHTTATEAYTANAIPTKLTENSKLICHTAKAVYGDPAASIKIIEVE